MSKTAAVFNKKKFINDVTETVRHMYRKQLKEASQQEIFQAVSYVVKDVVIDDWLATQQAFDDQDPKIVYYMSMEFLMGRALGNNLINLKAYKEVKEALEEIGLNLDVIEDQEPDPALGNGGLGRLAACFMESLATLGYAAYGCGIRYRYGMFKQKIKDGFQVEVPDNWLKNGYPFELRRPEYSYEVKFGGYVRAEVTEEGKTRFVQENYQSVLAVPYDMPIVGYGNHVVDTLMIWDAEPMECFELDSFDKGDYHKAVEQENLARNLVEVLYPNDNHIAGKELPGAKLTILDEDGKVVESWTSTEEAHYIEMLPIGKYMLREETAPEGYLVAKDVEFEVKDTAEVQKVVMVDEEKPKESTPEGGKPSKDAPKTGDNTNLLLWLIVLGMSFSGVVVLGRKIKKK